MKFAHEFQEALAREGFPDTWVQSAIPYGQLKKCIKRVQNELRTLGLDPATLGQLVHSETASLDGTQQTSSSAERPLSFQYEFARDVGAFKPKLTLFIKLKDGMPIDASLAPETRSYLQGLALKSSFKPNEGKLLEANPSSAHDSGNGGNSNTGPFSQTLGLPEDSEVRRIEVPLVFDDEFFGLLQGDVDALDNLQAEEQKVMSQDIKDLAQVITGVTKPSRFNHKDLDQWRTLFDLYLQAAVFFSTNELDHGRRNSTMAVKQLKWFQEQVDRRGLLESFKLPQSREALSRFVSINLKLLQNLKFQEINQQAITKILKKFDKRTSLGAKRTFPRLIESRSLMSEDMAKAVCAAVSQQLIRTVPQLDDYTCPVCCSLAWKPVRLACGHLFCIRCMIVMQREKNEYCPLCREKVVMAADSTNLDADMMKFMKKWFPNESKQKQKENEIEAGVDVFGEAYREAKPCTIM